MPDAAGVNESAGTGLPLDEGQLRTAVLAYIAEHPGAMDTLEGIAGWWIPRHRIRVEVDRLDSVLEGMVRDGSLESVDAAGRRMYRLARRQRGEE